jgi:2-hydroxy-3-oxopropionate reductase
MTTTVGFVGLGIMGGPMAANLLKAGFDVVGHNRSPEPVRRLEEAGGRGAASLAEAVADAEVVITMLPDSPDVEAVALADDGIYATARPGTLHVDMSTIRPDVARRLAAAGRDRGLRVLDAPVSGGQQGAVDGTLSIMVGGEAADHERARPLFELLGRNIVHQGGPGAGQHTKMCNQIVIAGTMIGVCESLVYAARAGLDLETLLRSIKSGAAGCWTLENLAPRVIRRDFAPGFIAEHFIKDMGIALDEARRMKLALPGLALVHQLYVAVAAQGHGRGGTQALMLALEHLSGL